MKRIYDEAINAFKMYSNGPKKLVGLQIATRPDCINEEIAKLISSYKNELYVAVELGLQTANDNNNFLNRCYSNTDFENAVKILNKYDIDIIAHIMVGLPKQGSNTHENHDDIINTVKFLNSQRIQGLKIHSCYVVKNTYLETLYNEKEYTPLSLEEYLDELSYILTHMSPDIVIHRISGDAPKESLVAPEWNTHKKWILNGIYKKLKEENLWQGINYTK